MRLIQFAKGQRPILHLLLNHLDAWGSTFIIAVLALILHDALTAHTLLLVVALTAGYWLAFAINDYCDAPFDAADEHKARRNFFVRYSVSPRSAKAVLFAISAFLLVVFASFGWSGIAAIAIALFVTWAYSAPPLRFKNRPGLDLLVHAVFVETFPYLVCLTLAQLTWTRLDVVLLVVLFLASLTAQLEQQLRDFDVDVETGRTFATVVGRRNTTRLLQLATALLILVGAYHVFDGTIPLFVTAFGLIGLPALLHRFLRGRSKPRSEKLVYLSALTGLAYVGLILIFYVARS
ncbi:MAG: UbiA family prenyltransferase [bacterium]